MLLNFPAVQSSQAVVPPFWLAVHDLQEMDPTNEVPPYLQFRHAAMPDMEVYFPEAQRSQFVMPLSANFPSEQSRQVDAPELDDCPRGYWLHSIEPAIDENVPVLQISHTLLAFCPGWHSVQAVI